MSIFSFLTKTKYLKPRRSRFLVLEKVDIVLNFA